MLFRSRDETRQKGLQLPGNTHKDEGEMWADLPAFRQGHARGIYMNPSPQQYNIHYTEREGGKVRAKSKGFPLATERTVSYAKSVWYSD